MKYKTSSISITSDMFNYTFKPKMETKLRLFADYGFEYLHWCDDWHNDVFYSKQDFKNYHELLDSFDINCVDVHGTACKNIRIDSQDKSGLKKYIQLLKNRVEFCSAVGGDAVVIHPPKYRESNDQFNKSLEKSLHALKEVTTLCNDLNISLAIENISANDELILNYYFERFPPEVISFCFDSGHAHLHNNFDSLLQFRERLTVLHLHDNKGKIDAHQPPFWGTIDWEFVMNWIKEISYPKPINFEITHYTDLFEGTMTEFLEYSVMQMQKIMNLR